MPSHFRYFAARRLLIQHFVGMIGLPEVLAHYDRVLCHPALPATSHELTDMRRIIGLGCDGRPMAGLVAMLSAEYLRRQQVFQRGAVLVGAGPGEFAARLFLDALPATVQPRYAIFREPTAALAWLELDAPDIAPRRTDHCDCSVEPPTCPVR